MRQWRPCPCTSEWAPLPSNIRRAAAAHSKEHLLYVAKNWRLMRKKLFESVKQLEQVYFLNLNSIDKKLYYSIAAMDVSRKLWQYFAQPQHKVCWWRRGGRSGAGQLGARPGSVIVTRIAAAISTISTQNIYNIYTEYLQYLHRISSIYTGCLKKNVV